MVIVDPGTVELSDAWQEGVAGARWRSGPGTTPDDGARASGSSVLEVPPGSRLPWHTDSAEETIVVLAGRARVRVGDEEGDVPTGGAALVPEGARHEVENAGDDVLRFLALYASTDVTTRYEDDVQPDGARERRPLD